jgi:hypothetical protein
LYIARECAALNQAVFELDGGINPETGRLHRFVLSFHYDAAVL